MSASSTYHREYYQKNKEKLQAKNQRWKEANREKINAAARVRRREDPLKRKESDIRYAAKHPHKLLLVKARANANRGGLAFNLDLSDIIIPCLCPYLKIPLTSIRGAKYVDSNASIDRIDPTKGYIKGNVQVISYLANRMKQNASRAQLLQFAMSILEQESKKELK